jgi:AraC-like DNA-binding protein
VLEHRELLASPSLSLSAVRCRGAPAWTAEEPVTSAAVVLVRRGVFLRRVRGVTAAADVTTGYVQRPGEEQQIGHPAGGDVCTTLAVPAEVAERLARAGPVVVPPAADLAHRRLLARARAGRVDVQDLAAEVLAALLPAPVVRQRGVEQARAALHADPELSLDELAGLVGWSPWHLSRAFHRGTGLTLRAYRLRLRVRRAIDGLAGGAGLAEVARRAGFADQAHMSRAVRREVDASPGAVRRLLRADGLDGEAGAAPAPRQKMPTTQW